MNVMPLGAGASGGMPPAPQMPMPSPDQIEQAQLILDACAWEDVAAILRSDDRRNYTIDVQTDATAFEDEETEKQQRIELAKAMTEFFAFWGPAIQQNPSIKPFVRELALFTFGAFRAGRALEETLGDAFDQIEQAPPPPDPEADKIKAEMAMREKEHAFDMQGKVEDRAKAQQDAAIEVQSKQADIAIQQRESEMDLAARAADLQFERRKAVLELELERERMQLEREKMAMERQKLAMEMHAANQNAWIEQQSAAADHERHIEKSELDMQTHREASEIKRDDMQFTSEMKRKQAAQPQEKN